MKRFTETDKWRDPWFRKLPPKFKMGYLFLLDNADNAGVWQPDYELAEFQIGEPLDWPEFKKAMGDRLLVLQGSGKWHLTRFIKFQFGELNPECKPHQQVIRLLAAHEIQRVSKGYPKGMDTPKDKDKDKDKDQDKDKDRDNAPSARELEAESVWALYPKKKGKKDAMREILEAIRTVGIERIRERTQAFAAAVSHWPEDERKYVLDPVRWFKRGNYDDDPETWQRKSANGVPQLEAHLNVF